MGNSTQAPPQAFGIQTPMNAFGDHGRMPYPPASYPPPGNGYWGDYGKGLYDGYPPGLPQRRDDSNSRRLSERISNFVADIPANAGLPPKPPAALDSALNAGNSNGVRRRNTSGQVSAGPPPPPPPDAKEDPRAAAGRRVSYHDMDLVAEVCSICGFRVEISIAYFVFVGRCRADLLMILTEYFFLFSLYETGI